MSALLALALAGLGFVFVMFLAMRWGSARARADASERILRAARQMGSLSRRLRDPDERQRLRRKFFR